MKKALIDLFRLTKREYFADFFITTPITLVVAAFSLANATPAWPLEFAFGWLVWTFYEYATHRWLLHRAWFFRDMHALHHDNQKDYIALPPQWTLTLYSIAWVLFGVQSSAWMVGFSFGYVVYAFAHTAFHYARIPADHWAYPAKYRHAIHHKFEDTHYGVTTVFWDALFGTTRRKYNV